jgi:hypothetical protein
MALNKKIKDKVEEKTSSDHVAREAILKMLKAVDEGKQFKRILEPILKTV